MLAGALLLTGCSGFDDFIELLRKTPDDLQGGPSAPSSQSSVEQLPTEQSLVEQPLVEQPSVEQPPVVSEPSSEALSEPSEPSEPSAPPSDGSEERPLPPAVAEDGCFRYYYSFLTAEQQEDYNALLRGFRTHQLKIGGLSEDKDVVFAAAEAVYYDHQELLWLKNGGGTLYYGQGQGRYEPDYLFSLDEGERLFDKAAGAAEDFWAAVDPEAGDYEKVKAVFEYLVDETDYTLDTVNHSNLGGALADKRASCIGYSAAAQYLLRGLGVQSIIVTGETERTGHAWNLVWVDGEPYHMDVTWGDPSFKKSDKPPEGYRNYAYLLATTEEILQTRTLDENIITLPECTSSRNYFVREGLCLDNVDEYAERLSAAVDAGGNYLAVRFSSASAFDEAVETLVDEGEIFSMLRAAGILLPKCSYIMDEEQLQLTIFFS